MDSRNFSSQDNSFTNTDKILCCYINSTKQIQIARISNISFYYYERVVFPKDRLFFEALPNDFLEIYTGAMISAFLSDKILCSRLLVSQNSC